MTKHEVKEIIYLGRQLHVNPPLEGASRQMQTWTETPLAVIRDMSQM